jgi:hypothetical protein
MLKKLLINSFALALINFISIICGYGIHRYFLSSFASQITVQVIIAFSLIQILFVFWDVIVTSRYRTASVELTFRNIMYILLLSLFIIPVIFIPAHYIGKGFMTSFSNIYYTWLFQIPVNIIALFLARLFIYEKFHPKFKH